MLRTTLANHVRKVRKDEGGFTLIELLIVIVILGVLAGIVVFGVGTFTTGRRGRGCKADCKTVSVAAGGVQRQERQLPGRRRRRWSPPSYLKAATRLWRRQPRSTLTAGAPPAACPLIDA